MIKPDSINLDVISGLQDNCVINSIYLDNDDYTMYHDRTGKVITAASPFLTLI